jgi:uncharacterized protein (DUF1330 family)
MAAYLDPGHDNVVQLLNRGLSGPVVMLNLLRFREWADYTNDPHLAPPEPISGRLAYDRYVEHTRPFLEASGGSIVFMGQGGHFFIGPSDETWDLAMLIGQNSVDDFFAFADNPEYLAGIGHRTAALLDSRLLPLQDISPAH